MPPNCRRVANAKMGLHPRFDRRSTSFKARNGVGARPDGKVIFAVSEGEVSFDAFARLFRDGLNCPNALFSTGAAPRAKEWAMDLPLCFSLIFAWIEPQRARPGKQP